MRVTLCVALNICTCSEPPLHTVCISCVPSPAGLSGSLWGVKCMQADGVSATCRSSRLGSVALTAVDYTPVLSPHLSGKGTMTPQRRGPVSCVEPSDKIVGGG